MEVIEVDGQLTLEWTCEKYVIDRKHFAALAKNNPIGVDEGLHYLTIYNALEKAILDSQDNSRQARVVHEATDGYPCCISVVQYLGGERYPRQLVCYWRSSSTEWLQSDLGFLARFAQEWQCNEIVCYPASLHVPLTKERKNPPPVGKPVVSRSLNCERCGKTNLEYGGMHVCV